ncbi:hypothetical protein QEH52_10620 [Coraliomargarita sp. SDUM461003]|uniref:DUF4064 domain-containing protein n=1 Tax=Thalassobacterium maritimum TaxID=3041265 RepID=A0ABU1AXY8_9BACT|nr:hypothetical protein [Coraliomargarita sp. SDUM461003]MDQ8207965.1 hypothetical protein [Coraliomargarita sp. SDUM461003]
MKKGKIFALVGACLQLGPLFGILVSILAMIGGVIHMSDFDNLGGVSESSLEFSMVVALYAPLLGLLGNMIGYICLLFALFVSRYRAPWFFWFMTIYSALILLLAPVGTVLGIVVLVYIIPRKEEFYGRRSHLSAA